MTIFTQVCGAIKKVIIYLHLPALEVSGKDGFHTI